tara:strand:- start:1102 stop:1941 length:840 start_codon:yes stop_codon:yes gene_type:complete
MIIWLASYPKSGNTWVRVLISNIIKFKKIDYENPFALINQIESYPNIKHFSRLIKNSQNPDEIVPNWINSQNILNLNKDIKLFKTHNMLGSFGDYSFTDTNNTAGVIHIVRDPRNVVSSLKNHFSLNDMSAAKKFILAENNWLYGKDSGVLPTFVSSWKMHYLSWKNFPKNYLLIKYEDLLKKPIIEIRKIYNYLKNFFELNLNSEDLNGILKLSTFENLKKKEKEGKFKENMDHLETKKKINFFDSGPSNDWRKQLNKDLLEDLEKEFAKEMKELGYI